MVASGTNEVPCRRDRRIRHVPMQTGSPQTAYWPLEPTSMEVLIVITNYYRHQLESKRKQRVNTEKKAGEYRNREADKRSAATKVRAAAATLKL
jgi:hypothetical protein